MINDGYTQSASVNGISFEFRPVLSHERRSLLAAFSRFDKPHRDGLRIEWLDRHVIASDFGSLRCLARDARDTFEQVALVLMGVAGGDPLPNEPQWDKHWEYHDVENLRQGLRLEFTYPGLAKRTCESCQVYWYDSESATPYRDQQLPIVRPTEAPPPCRIPGSSCPVGTPERQQRLSSKNHAAWTHFQMCDAIGVFPDDAIVARNARVIREVLNGQRKPGRAVEPRREPVGRRGGIRPAFVGADPFEPLPAH